MKYPRTMKYTRAVNSAATSAVVLCAAALSAWACSGTNELDAGGKQKPGVVTTAAGGSGGQVTEPPDGMGGQGPGPVGTGGATPTTGGGGSAMPPATGGGTTEGGAGPVGAGGEVGAGGGAPVPGTCGAGYTSLGGDCVSEAAVCGATVCGIGQTCMAGACTAASPTIVVEAENFAYRFNPGNERTWYTLVEGRAAPWVTADKTTGFPCALGGANCEDSSANDLTTKGGKGMIEIMPDTRRAHADTMVTYCGGFPDACANASYDGHIKLAATFPGYKAVTTHDRTEFYPAPGEGPGVGYRVHFVQAGTYQVWDYGGRPNSESNSVHVGVNTATQAPDVKNGEKWPAGTWETNGRGLIHCGGTFTWSNVRRNDGVPGGSACGGAAITISIPAPGVYTVWFTMREDGYQIDKWVAQLDGAAPNGNAQAEVGRVELEGGLDKQPKPDCVGCEKFK